MLFLKIYVVERDNLDLPEFCQWWNWGINLHVAGQIRTFANFKHGYVTWTLLRELDMQCDVDFCQFDWGKKPRDHVENY